MLALAAVLLTPSWVLFSPVVRTLADKAYENSARTPWTGPSSFNLDMVSIRWSLPPNTYSDTALGGGITFALHRDFCARLLPLFPEEAGVIPGQEATFLSCDELRDTVRRGMDTWAINHKNLNFVDVTDRCRDVESVLSCPYAELFIVPETLEISDSSVNDRAAEVRHDLSSVDFYPFSTAGNQLSPGLGVTNTRLVVRAPTSASTFCWYLDSTFCYQFHRWQYADIDVVMIGRIACAAIFGLAFMVVVWVLGQMVNAVRARARAHVSPSPPLSPHPHANRSRHPTTHLVPPLRATLLIASRRCAARRWRPNWRRPTRRIAPSGASHPAVCP